ncbi:MAG: DUF2975 domain-containing protein [Lachnospiraceae bacterium]|nr:DUF2975 domain-containing protein [Lachnospiraceae bacterium]
MNKEQAVKSINSIGKAGYIIAKICKIGLIIGMIGSLIAAIVLFVIPNDLFRVSLTGNGVAEFNFEAADKSVIPVDIDESTIKEFDLELNQDDYVSTEMTVSEDGKMMTIALSGGEKYASPDRVAVILLIAAVYMIICIVVMSFVEKLCKALKTSESPFAENVITSMERFSWSLIPWAVLTSMFENYVDQAFSRNINLEMGISLSSVLVVVLIFGLVRVFKYGAVLQQESDETL